jgi:hypothetical protein
MPRLIAGALILSLGLVQAPTHLFPQQTKPQPMTAKQVWSTIKNALVAQDGEEYFEHDLKGAMVPGGVAGVALFTGTLLSAEPAAGPAVLVIAISDRTTPEVTLQMKDSHWRDTHLSGPLVRGSLIQFEGVAMSFTKEPFMLTFGVSVTKGRQVLKVIRPLPSA